MTVVGPGRSEFTKLVADHVFVDSNRDVLAAIVDAESQTNELRQDRGGTGPVINNLAATAFTNLLRLLEKIAVNKRAFPY